MRKSTLLLLVILLAPAPAGAMLYSQPVSGSQFGLDSNLPAAATTDQQVADRFSLAGPASVASVTWYGFFDATRAGDESPFEIRFFGDAGGPVVPSSASVSVLATAVATGLTSSGNHSIFAYTAALPGGVALAAGSHWISITESDPATTLPWRWANSDVGEATNHRILGASGWTPLAISGREHRAFTLVPEPSVLALGGVGALLLRVRRRGTRRTGA